ncbi:MAG: hypothetical protein AAB385_10670, partial [Planctomycetota bacterium]
QVARRSRLAGRGEAVVVAQLTQFPLAALGLRGQHPILSHTFQHTQACYHDVKSFLAKRQIDERI